jgi:hypothetical protein
MHAFGHFSTGAGTMETALTKREQETFNAIKQAGKRGISFPDLKTKLGVEGVSTLRQRLSILGPKGKGRIISTKSGRNATYTAA